MKFARIYQDRLTKDGFPPHWVDSAISYGQLKKCIKRVQNELSSIGLDVETLHKLLESVEKQRSALKDDDGGDEKPFQYIFYGPGASNAPVLPKLLFVVDEETGEPLDATLAPETKNYLHQLALSEKLTDIRITDEGEEGNMDTNSLHRSSTASSEGSARHGKPRRSSSRPYRLVEVPLTTDSEFFGALQTKLSGIADIQSEERMKLTSGIQQLGKVLVNVTNPTNSKSKQDLAHWRRIFELYLDSRIFFATNEQDHGVHTGAQAQEAFRLFLEKAQKADLLSNFKRKESVVALQQFLDINAQLLQCLKFQEINQIAMTKILKKFDKRTALGAKISFPTHLPNSMLSEDFSKALAAQVSTEIVSVVPQLDDYLCPVCFTISYRPIRLRCQHLFCIRCLIVMQRDGKDRCPLCRLDVVMEADSSNLDPAMTNFLVRYFPDEVKAKQKDNERALAVDQFGSAVANDKCCVM